MQWEYKTVKLGADGWELVAGLDTNWLWGETNESSSSSGGELDSTGRQRQE